MLERGIAPRLSLRVQRVRPLGAVVSPALGIIAREKTVAEAVAIADDPGGVGVFTDVFFLDAVVLDGIVDHAADESNVGARAQFGEHVRYRAGAIETRI